MNIYLDSQSFTGNLYPFTLTRHIADIPVGILTIKEKWEALTSAKIYTHSEGLPDDCLQIPAHLIPTRENLSQILEAAREKKLSAQQTSFRFILYPWQIVQWNDWAMRQDFELLTRGKTSANLPGSVRTSNPDEIFVSASADLKHCIINADTGPVYIGPGVTIMEGAFIRGPFAIGKNSVVKMGTKIYGATHVGENCVVGGEIKNSLILSNSNKAHDGYMGDSMIGSWCNWGAGTSNSNVKNTGTEVSYCLDTNTDAFPAGNKGGVLMGDYCRTAVNTVFNTGAVIGVCCNIFGDVSSKKYMGSFSWGNERYHFDKAIRDIQNWKLMKHQNTHPEEIENLKNVFNQE